MIKMVNQHTGAVDFVNSDEAKSRLEDLGYREVKEENKTAVKKAATKKNTTPKGEKKK